MSDERQLQFVDTNILVYAHDISAGGKSELAREIVQRLWETEDGCLSIQVLQEFYVTATQKVPTPLDAPTASRIIRDLAYWKVHVPNEQDVLGAIDLHQRYTISFWDAMIIWSAKRLGCSTVWTEDLNPDQDYDSVKVVNPFTR